MTWLALALHALNFALPAAVVASLASLGAKLVWRRELAERPLWLLAASAFGAGLAALVAGWAATGRDGAMASYVALCAASATALWWTGFVRGRGDR